MQLRLVYIQRVIWVDIWQFFALFSSLFKLFHNDSLLRETYEKQKIDVKAKTQEKKTAERTLESKVSDYGTDGNVVCYNFLVLVFCFILN